MCIHKCEPENIHSQNEADQSEVVQSDIEAMTVFLESSFERNPDLHRVFKSQGCSSSLEHGRTLTSCLGCSQFSRVSWSFNVFACTQVALENTCAVVPKVKPFQTWAAFSSAQAAPEHACATCSSSQMTSVRTSAVFSSAQVAPEQAHALFWNA